jgi:hypothetical protein
MLQYLFESIAKIIRRILGLVDQMMQESPFLFTMVFGVLLSSLTITIFYLIKDQFFRITRLRTSAIKLVNGARSASKPLIISANPTEPNYKEIPKSYNQPGGVEFTYNIWFVIDEKNNSNDEWQHLFHKGSGNGYPLQAPGVWIKGNKLRVSMNTTDNINNIIEIPDPKSVESSDTGLPINKWCMLTIITHDNILDVYINGYLIESRQFTKGVVRLNNESIYITNFDGFNGYVSDFEYFNYAITGMEIKNLFDNNPTMDGCSVGYDVPPYLFH